MPSIMQGASSIDDSQRLGIFNENPLWLAAEEGSDEAVRDQINLGSDVDKKTCDSTPLLIAVLNDHTSVVIKLLEAGADSKAANQHSYTPMMVAAQKDYLGSLKALLRSKASPNKDHGPFLFRPLRSLGRPSRVVYTCHFSPLFLAAKNGSSGCLKELLRAKADIDLAEETDDEMNSALHEAFKQDHPECVQALLAAKANFYQENSFGSTPIMMIKKTGQLECLRILIESKININQVNSRGNTALSIAARFGNRDQLRALLEANGNPNYPVGKRNSPLMNAAYGRNSSCLLSLIKAKAQLNEESKTKALEIVKNDSNCLKILLATKVL